jgi:hypothetical protein
MAFPSNPTNGQNAVVNYISYTYNSSIGAWTNTAVNAAASPVLSVAGKTGAVVLNAADIGAGGTMLAAMSINNTLQATSLGIGTAPSGVAGQILATNSITAFYSDERLKTKIATIENALDKIDQLTGFLYVENELANSLGFINPDVQVALSAQAVQKVQPEATALAPFDRDENGNSKSGEHYLTIQYERLVPLIVEAIKELRAEVNTLKRDQ